MSVDNARAIRDWFLSLPVLPPPSQMKPRRWIQRQPGKAHLFHWSGLVIKQVERCQADEEVSALYRCQLPPRLTHVVHVVAARETPTHILLGFPRLPGTLEQALAQPSWVARLRPWQIVQDLLDTMSELHARNQCHGDIKPSNLLVDDEGCVCFNDWDVAYPQDEAVGHQLFTSDYRPPELFAAHPDQIRAGWEQDIWALGSCIFQLFTNHQLIRIQDYHWLDNPQARRERQTYWEQIRHLLEQVSHEVFQFRTRPPCSNPDARLAPARLWLCLPVGARFLLTAMLAPPQDRVPAWFLAMVWSRMKPDPPRADELVGANWQFSGKAHPYWIPLLHSKQNRFILRERLSLDTDLDQLETGVPVCWFECSKNPELTL